MSWPWIAGAAAVGLAAGPPIRAVIVCLAVPSGQPPRSGCANCGADIMTGRLPAGLALHVRRRCPSCGAGVGPPLLPIELISALLLAGLAARVHPPLVLAAACWLALAAIPLTWIDALVQRLPDVLTFPAWAGTMALLLIAATVGGTWHNLVRAVVGGVVSAAFYLVLYLISHTIAGLGDSKASASTGSLLAWFGWGTFLAGTAAGFLLAAVYAVILLVTGRAGRGDQIPFGPFIMAGAFLALLTGR